jgi:Tol biopolymer transport system component
MAVLLAVGLWLSLSMGQRDRNLIADLPSPSPETAQVTRLEPSTTQRAPSTTFPTPSPTVQGTPLVAPTTSTLEPAAATRIIAFVFRQGDADEIYMIRADGRQLVDISNHPEPYYVPVWAPNGQQLAFISGRTGRPEIFLVLPDGSGLEQITHTPVDSKDMSGFVWLPDSAQLAVTYPTTITSDPRVGTVRLISVDGLVRTTTALAPVDRPEWSPDGNRLAYDGLDPHDNLALFVAQTDGTGAKIIVGSQGDVADTSEFLMGFAWAPDSTRLAYIMQGPLLGTWPNQHMGGDSSHARIFSIRSDGSDRQLLIDMEPMPNGLIGPSWSPDGRYLLYLISQSGATRALPSTYLL